MHYYKRNIGDYAKKAGRLSMLEHGAYTLLIDACYDRERFPTEQEAIEWAWARTDAEVEAVRFVLSRFFVLTDGVYVQERIRDEVDAYTRNAENNARIAREREEKRTKRARSVDGACASVNEAPPNQEPLTTNQEPSIEAPQSAANKRGTRLPQDWALPLKWGEWTLSQFPTWTPATVRSEADKFRDFWHSKAGKDACKLDWEATWRNWCRNAKPSIQGQPQRETPYAQHMRERVEQAAGSLAHIVAAKAPGQYQRIREPWEVAADEQRTIENGQTGTPAISMD
jgi:uncharacterized protein YdaU (DUF1376 family)